MDNGPAKGLSSTNTENLFSVTAEKKAQIIKLFVMHLLQIFLSSNVPHTSLFPNIISLIIYSKI
jgi:hypothetical protein